MNSPDTQAPHQTVRAFMRRPSRITSGGDHGHARHLGGLRQVRCRDDDGADPGFGCGQDGGQDSRHGAEPSVKPELGQEHRGFGRRRQVAVRGHDRDRDGEVERAAALGQARRDKVTVIFEVGHRSPGKTSERAAVTGRGPTCVSRDVGRRARRYKLSHILR
jgi:hypothetical protein